MKFAFSFSSITACFAFALLGNVSAQTSPATSSPTSAAVSPSARGADTVFARAPKGLTITANDVMTDMTRMPVETRRIMVTKPDSLQQIASNLIVRRALAQEAEQGKLADDPLVASALALARDRVLSDARLAQMDAQNAPNEAAIQAYARQFYQTNSEKYERPAQTRARHILLPNDGPDAMAAAKAVLAKLRAGASFEETAKAQSKDPGSAARGGDLGFFGPGQMVRPFEDAVNKLANPGDLSDPVESQFGLHIIKLEARREKGKQTFEEVAPQLLAEARTAILNEARVQKVSTMMAGFTFETSAIESFAKSQNSQGR